MSARATFSQPSAYSGSAFVTCLNAYSAPFKSPCSRSPIPQSFHRSRFDLSATCVHIVGIRLGGARTNHLPVEHPPRLPRIPLVDRIALAIELIRAIEMRALLDRPLPSVFDLAAPIDQPPIGVASLHLQPDIERIHRSTGK